MASCALSGLVGARARVVHRVVEQRGGEHRVEVVDAGGAPAVRRRGGTPTSRAWRCGSGDAARDGGPAGRRVRRRSQHRSRVAARGAARPRARSSRPSLRRRCRWMMLDERQDRCEAGAMAVLIDEPDLVVPWPAMVASGQRRELGRAARVRRAGQGFRAAASRATTTTCPRSASTNCVAAGAVMTASRELLRRLRAAGLRLSPAERRGAASGSPPLGFAEQIAGHSTPAGPMTNHSISSMPCASAIALASSHRSRSPGRMRAGGSNGGQDDTAQRRRPGRRRQPCTRRPEAPSRVRSCR